MSVITAKAKITPPSEDLADSISVATKTDLGTVFDSIRYTSVIIDCNCCFYDDYFFIWFPIH